jgi:hypothetical protein
MKSLMNNNDDGENHSKMDQFIHLPSFQVIVCLLVLWPGTSGSITRDRP